MQIRLSESRLLVAWLALWLFVANVPTEASVPAYPHFLRLFSWTMVWIPLLLVHGLSLRKQMVFIAGSISMYAIVLNLGAFNFDAALMVANIATALVIVSTYANSRFTSQFLKALDVVLIVWAVMFLVQLAVYLATGQILEFHSMIFSFSEARYSTAMGNIYRLTGPHIEPGTYSAWVYGLALVRMTVGARMLTPSTVLALATLPLTLSAWGMLVATTFVIVAIIMAATRMQRLWSAGALLLLCGLALYFYGGRFSEVQAYFLERANLVDASGQSKAWAYSDFLRDFSQYVLWGKNFKYDYCGGCLSPQDAGIGLNFVVYFGLPFILWAGFMILRSAFRRGGWALVLFSLPLFFAKYFIWEVLFWIIFLLSFDTARLRSNHSSNF